MTRSPLVSIITPAWQRADLLCGRCIPSVQAQTYPNVEHVIVVDGPDPELAMRALAAPQQSGPHPVTVTWLPEHDPGARWGHWARLHGIEIAKGDIIGYCDDDDALKLHHVEALVRALQQSPDAGFAWSWMQGHSPGGDYLVGAAQPGYGQIGTPSILHHRSLLEVATWEQSDPTIDWDLVSRWLAAGVTYATVDEPTVDIWPSAYR